jgi:hypothetical protein
MSAALFPLERVARCIFQLRGRRVIDIWKNKGKLKLNL